MRTWESRLHTEHRKLPCGGKDCWTIDQCFREILNINYTVKEIVLFNEICKAGMVDD